MRTVRIFGLTLASDMPFASHLPPGEGAPDLVYVQGPVPAGGDRLYDSGLIQLDRLPGMEVLRFPSLADFALESRRISAQILDPGRPDLVELRLLGPVFSHWLERQGTPTLHASAVRHGSGAVAFLARHGGGKSSLAASLMAAGAPLLTDDILPLEDAGGAFLARPGYPQIRMEPDTARWFLGSDRGLAAVAAGESKLRMPVGDGGWGSFEGSALPLTAVYVAERRQGPDVEIYQLPRGEAVIELVRHSFSPWLVEAAGLQPRRLDLFARLVRQVPVLRLSYPAGFAKLPRVAEILNLG